MKEHPFTAKVMGRMHMKTPSGGREMKPEWEAKPQA